MTYDVYICYAPADRLIAETIAAGLESRKLRCFYEGRDLPRGEDAEKAREEAILSSGLMVVVFTEEANSRQEILRQIGVAAKEDKVIVPFKMCNVKPEGIMSFYLGPLHWLDAMNDSMEEACGKLYELLEANLHPEASRPMPKKEKKQKVLMILRLILDICVAVFSMIVIVSWVLEALEGAWEDPGGYALLALFVVAALLSISSGIRIVKELHRGR